MAIENYRIQDCRDTLRYAKMISRHGLSRMPPLVITCAITGGVHGKEANPNLPESLEEQVQAAYDAYQAGASIVHIHRRDPADPARMSSKAEEYLEVNARVRERCPDLIINNTCVGQRRADMGPDGAFHVGPQLLTSLPARPELSSVDITCHSFNQLLGARKPPLFGRDKPYLRQETAFLTYPELENVIRLMKQYQVKPEFECFRLSDFKYLEYLEQKKMLDDPYWVQFLFNGSGAMPVVEQMLLAARLMPENGILSVIGIGAAQTAVVTQAMLLGFHVRVGLEDAYYYGPHDLAKSNAQMVDRVVRIATELGRPIATPAQAREMLHLGPPRAYAYPTEA